MFQHNILSEEIKDLLCNWIHAIELIVKLFYHFHLFTKYIVHVNDI